MPEHALKYQLEFLVFVLGMLLSPFISGLMFGKQQASVDQQNLRTDLKTLTGIIFFGCLTGVGWELGILLNQALLSTVQLYKIVLLAVGFGTMYWLLVLPAVWQWLLEVMTQPRESTRWSRHKAP